MAALLAGLACRAMVRLGCGAPFTYDVAIFVEFDHAQYAAHGRFVAWQCWSRRVLCIVYMLSESTTFTLEVK